uniref:Caprin-1_dimer domain-containing protein n=1 Tax=Loa loa TaxID=7209 RepID=A0A1I7VWW3_LOALO
MQPKKSFSAGQNKITPKASATCSCKDVKISKQQFESLNRRAIKIDGGIGELEKIASCTKNFDEKLLLDKQKIRDIDARLKALTKKEQKLNAELTKQMNIHFGKPFVKMTSERSKKSFYGVCEVIDGYQKAIENLDKALRTLEQIRNVPSMKSINSTIRSTPSVDEIDEITVLMRRFLAKLRVQLASVHLYGNPTLSPNLDTGENISLTNNNNDDFKSETTTGVGSLNRGSSSSDFDTTPLNTSQSIPIDSLTGPSTSSAHSQFMGLKPQTGSEGTITAEGKSDQISDDKK